ncbi:MAG TPA: PRC-barrel domain-containing protein [Gemmatimonadaceae bacterium]|jgi:hypothetical protein
MGRRYIVTDDDVRLAPLSQLKEFQVAEGHKDIRGWRVAGADGRDVGKVHDLIVDMDGMRTRYVDVRLNATVAAAEHARDVLVPIAAATLDDRDDVVRIPLSTDRVSLLPAFNHKHLLRADEIEIRRHFSLAEAASNASPAREREVYDDRKLEMRPVADAHPEEEVTRIPVDERDDVIRRRGEGGKDEIVIRRPRPD